MAGLIPQSFIDDLLDRADIVEVIDRRVKLKKTGKNYSARCPFHDEKTPSFSVNPDKQFYYCFGCGAGGNALGFLMEYENLEFPRAVENLADSLGMEVPREERQNEADRGQRELYDLMEKVANYYKEQLRHHPQKQEAVAYLQGRGLTGAIAGQYDLGYAPAGWDNLLKTLGQDEDSKNQLMKAGMLVENEKGRCYDRFRQRVVFPIRDQRGRVIAFGGRVLGDDKPKYLNSPETAIFQKGRELYGLYQAKKAQRQLERLVIVEGYMDVIALAQNGISYAAATLGTSTSEAHLEKVYRLCPEVVFCFDGDEAGRKAAARALEAALPCMQDGRQARFLFLPEGEDPDTLVRSQGAKHFEALVAQATSLENFLFELLGQGLDLESMDGRARLSKLAAPMLSRIPEGVYKQLMVQELARHTGLEQETLRQVIDTEPPPPPESPPQAAAEPAPRRRQAQPKPAVTDLSNPVQSAIALVLHKPEVARLVDSPDALAELDDDNIPLLCELLQLLKRRPESNTAMLLGHWHGTPEGNLLNQFASQERLIPSEGIENQFLDTIKLLQTRNKKTHINARMDELKRRGLGHLSGEERGELIRLVAELQRLDRDRSN
jgi:DNA primase